MAVPVLGTGPSVSRTWTLPSGMYSFLEQMNLQRHHYIWQDKCDPGKTLTKPRGPQREGVRRDGGEAGPGKLVRGNVGAES